MNASTAVVAGEDENIGAVIMGRNMFGGQPGPRHEPTWDGWGGENPPLHLPVFVLTHYARPPLVCAGAGMLDELLIHLVPAFLGDGIRLFDAPALIGVELEQTRAVEAPGVTHLYYRIARLATRKNGCAANDKGISLTASRKTKCAERLDRRRILQQGLPFISNTV